MTEFGDRLVILLVAATALAVFVMGWAAGFVEGTFGGWTEPVLLGVLAVVGIALLIGIWKEFNRID